MAQSWIVTCDPHVTFRFQTEYQDARCAILSFEHLVYRSISSLTQEILTPYDQRLYIQSLRESYFPKWQAPLEFEACAKELFQTLKNKRISAQAFSKVIQKLPDHFLASKQEIFLKLATLYEAYTQKKEYLDEEDILERAIEALKKPSFQASFPDRDTLPSKVLVLTYRLSDLQKIFLDTLAKTVEVEHLSVTGSVLSPVPSPVLSNEKPTHVLSVFETKTSEQEVEVIQMHIEKALQMHVPLSSLFVFCTRLADYRRELESVFKRADIPFSFWNASEKNINRVSLLEWHPHTLVFPHMKKVFLCGASSLPLESFFLNDEERAYFNQVFQMTVFKPQGDHREETKSLLHRLASRCESLSLTYSHRPQAAFEEFFKEVSPRVSVTVFHPRAPFVSRAKEKERPSPHSISLAISLALALAGKNKKDFLPKIYSIRSLTQYQNCPYGFLLKECFHLHPLQKKVLELTFQEEGEWIHDSLYRYFSKSLSLEQAVSQSVAILTDRFQKELLEPDQERITKLLRDFLEAEKVWRAKSRFEPRSFELAFGTDPQKPLELSWKGKTLFLRGKIDRVNIDEKAREFEVVDYKTGSTVPSTKEVMEGKSFQLTLYAMALENLFLPGYLPSRGFFYRVKDRDAKKGFQCETQDQWQDLKEKTLSEVFSLVEKIETLSFPPTPQHCYATCELKNMCEQS